MSYQLTILIQISLLLSSDVFINNDLPKEYNLQVTNVVPNNTFIFTEKDLPGYNDKKKSLLRRSPTAFYDRGRLHPSGVEKNKKRQPSYKKVVPSKHHTWLLALGSATNTLTSEKTAIAGQVQKEMNCLAVENHEYKHLMEERTLRELKARPETQLLEGPAAAHAGSLLVPGTIGVSTGFRDFIVCQRCSPRLLLRH
jgi:transcription initiation factor TFIIF subunit beta